MKNKFDLRFTKTEYLIKSEFIKLLERKQFSDISVSEICKYALCSRNAFYAHYENKDDLLDSIINEVLDRIDKQCVLRATKFQELSNTLLIEYCEKVINAVEKERNILMVFFKRNRDTIYKKLSDCIYESFIKNALKISKNADSADFRLYCRFASSGFVAFIVDSLEKYELPADEINRIFLNITKNFFLTTSFYLLKDN